MCSVYAHLKHVYANICQNSSYNVVDNKNRILYEFVNAVFNPDQQVNEAQVVLLSAAIELAMGRPA